MTSKLRNMLVGVGVVLVGSVAVYMSTPQPATRTMADLRDAGITDGQKFVVICPERFDARTRNRINRNQPNVLRPRQRYGHVARVAVCFSPDGGNCFRPSDGRVNIADLEGEVTVPSLRTDMVGTSDDAGIDDAGEDESVDDAKQYTAQCEMLTCPQADNAEDAGTFSNPYATRFCGALNRLALQPSPCMIPNGWRSDGGWCEEECGIVNCKGVGPYGLPDGGPRWRGFNVTPRDYATGPDCVPVECGVQAGDVPSEWL